MPNLVTPTVYFVGATEINYDEIKRYLVNSGQTDFLEDYLAARTAGIPGGLILCSMFAKLCYKSLVVGKNANVQKVRTVPQNLAATFDSGHGSVFEHCNLNFVISNCSRVFTHELVRHRAGTAFSQTSGRYCRLENIDFVLDPILDPVRDIFEECLHGIEEVVYLAECKLSLRKPPHPEIKATACYAVAKDHEDRDKLRWVPDDSFDFEKRKKITSAIRRIAPNGQANEIGFSVNIRALRHIVQLRTARYAEWEIRSVFNQIYQLVKVNWPTIFYKARTREYDGLLEVYGMKQNPYDVEVKDEA